MDENLKQLIIILARTVGKVLDESPTIVEAMDKIRARGIEPYVVLDFTIGYKKKEGE